MFFLHSIKGGKYSKLTFKTRLSLICNKAVTYKMVTKMWRFHGFAAQQRGADAPRVCASQSVVEHDNFLQL
jgi:hypothetical protein